MLTSLDEVKKCTIKDVEKYVNMNKNIVWAERMDFKDFNDRFVIKDIVIDQGKPLVLTNSTVGNQF